MCVCVCVIFKMLKPVFNMLMIVIVTATRSVQLFQEGDGELENTNTCMERRLLGADGSGF